VYCGKHGGNLEREKGGLLMTVITLLIAIIALIIAVLAFQRTGGTKNLKKTTAELLAKMEKRMREEEASKVLEKEKLQE
jgi:hypothetical protein